MTDDLATLRATIAERDETIRQLRALKLPPEAPYRGLGFSLTERVILGALMSARAVCSRAYLLECTALSRDKAAEMEPKAIDVMLCRVRRKLALAGFPQVIKAEPGEGWTIKANDRARVAAAFEGARKEVGIESSTRIDQERIGK